MQGSNVNITSSKPVGKTIGDPCASYMSIRGTWKKAKAILGGQSRTKAYDEAVMVQENILLPFSPYMAHDQYMFYKAEAELPGLVSQYARVLVGGLLRKNPQFTLPKSVPEGAKEWLEKSFGADGTSMVSFLDAALWEELNTSRAWVVIDYPAMSAQEYDAMGVDQRKDISPYCIKYNAEQVINWRRGKSGKTGKQHLTKFTVRMYTEVYAEGAHHPDLVDTVYDYNIINDVLVIQKWIRTTSESIIVNNGQTNPVTTDNTNAGWVVDGEPIFPMWHGENLDFIPAYPLNGSIEIDEPILQPLIDREIGLYNKISRRNHLLYGAATYTPVISSDMNDEEFQAIVRSGLGSWLKLPTGGKADVLKTPTEALKDMETSITNTIEEMARMGIRMLSPEGSSGESGVSLEIRNAAQTAQLGLLNVKVSQTMERIIQVMLKWKYDVDVDSSDIKFTLSQDFNPTPVGADWMRLVTEWYTQGIIPRSIFLAIAKQNDVIPPDYDDKDGVQEIQSDPLVDLTPTSIDVANLDRAGNQRPGAPTEPVKPIKGDK